MTLPLLQTKLYAPLLRPHLVSRAPLLTRLNKWRPRLLTLISAPAGFGKTTLVSEWVAQAACPAAWLALDEEDNDPTRFLIYLITALQSQAPTLGVSALALLTSPHPPAAKTILTLLLNDLATHAVPLILILDDYHAITTTAIHEAMTFMVEHLPAAVHLVITTRIDPPLPLARWRVRHQLTEIRADDLRFTAAEAALFLNQVMGLALTESQIATLETRTEGWIAGLQLAALSMQGRADVTEFIQAFSGSNRHVLSYLVEEVLNRCPPDTLNFLLQTSILDRMCASLCDAITGEINGQTNLTQLEQANLFLIPLDDEGKWYRYHHLFAEVLRTRLQQSQPALLPQLHRQACEWNTAHYRLDSAMHHALASSDLDLAAALVEEHATTLMLQSELLQLRNWVAQLPDDLIQRRPRLLLAQGWVWALVGQLAAAQTLLTSPALQSSALSADVAGEMALLRAVIAGFQSDPMALNWAQQALELLPSSRQDLRVTALNEIGLAYMRQGELVAARRTLLEVAKRAEAGNIRFTAVDAFATVRMILVRQGQLVEAVQACQEALAMVSRWMSDGTVSVPPATGMVYVGLGEVLVEWNDLAGATQALNTGLQMLQATIEKLPLARGYSARARVQQAQGNVDGALASFAHGEAWFAQMQIPEAPARAWLVAQRVRLWLRQGNLAAAINWAAQCADQEDVELNLVQNLTRVRLYLAQTRQTSNLALLDEAMPVLTAALRAAEAGEWVAYVIECLLLHALILHAQNDTTGAVVTLERVLPLAEPGGYLRLFLDEGEPMRLLILDFRSFQNKLWIAQEPMTEQNANLSIYVNKMLSSFGSEQATEDKAMAVESLKAQNLVEPLSARELEVLQLVAAGLSNTEIAAKLIVTTGTIKTHINHIFGKLTVESRIQAVVRARELGLLTN